MQSRLVSSKMELKIISEKQNALFNRKEIVAEVEAEVTPSNAEIKKLLYEKFSAPSENIRIQRIEGKFGVKIFTISANIYSSKEDLQKIEYFSKKEIERMKQESERPAEEKTETPTENPEENKENNEEVN